MNRKGQTNNKKPLRDARGEEIYINGKQIYELKTGTPCKKAMDLQMKNYRRALNND